MQVDTEQDQIETEYSSSPPLDDDATKSQISIAQFNEVLEQARKISQQTTLEISQLRTSRQSSNEPTKPSDQKKSRPTSKWLREPTPKFGEEEKLLSQTTTTPNFETKPKSQEIISQTTTTTTTPKYFKNEQPPKAISHQQEEILLSQTTITPKYLLNEPTKPISQDEHEVSQITSQYLREPKPQEEIRSQTAPIIPVNEGKTLSSKAPFYEFLEEAMKSSEKINSTSSIIIPQPALEITPSEDNTFVQSRLQTPETFSPTKVCNI